MAKKRPAPEPFHARLARLRQAAHLAPAELARRAGLSRQLLAKYEAGATLPRLDAARRLADALGVSLDDLLPS